MSNHLKAALQTLLVAFLWSTSWVLIKIGLEAIPALTFAGLRYFLAFLCLIPFAFRQKHLVTLRSLSRKQWGQLAFLALTMYCLSQGAQFLALVYLPAASANLVLSFTPVLVAVLSIHLLSERLIAVQWLGIVVFLIGATFYFYPASFEQGQLIGLGIIIIGLISTALGSIMGRALGREANIRPVLITALSMGMGSLLLLGTGILAQGLPLLSLQSWLIILWLAVVNTAFAFTLYNHSLRTLPAAESSIIINTMLIQIPLLAWIFLGEALTVKDMIGLGLAALGTLVVQLRGRFLFGKRRVDRGPLTPSD